MLVVAGKQVFGDERELRALLQPHRGGCTGGPLPHSAFPEARREFSSSSDVGVCT
jgi:hypothetical protein